MFRSAVRPCLHTSSNPPKGQYSAGKDTKVKERTSKGKKVPEKAKKDKKGQEWEEREEQDRKT